MEKNLHFIFSACCIDFSRERLIGVSTDDADLCYAAFFLVLKGISCCVMLK